MEISKKQKILVVAVIIAIMVAIGIVYAATTYSQTISWTYQPVSESFAVSNSDPTDLGEIVGSKTFTRIYDVTNDGNVPITVTVSVTGVGYTASWDETTAIIPVGESTTFTLSLTVEGDGGCTVTIDQA
jgi:hypothetical protein